MRGFLDALPDRILCVLDEAYAEYADAEPEGPALVREGHGRLCVLRTFSKVYGLAALRVGYALASPEVADALDRVRPIFNLNQPAQDAAVASLDEADAVAERVAHAARGAGAAGGRSGRAGLRPVASQANFVYADTPDGDGDGLADRLLREGFIVRALRGFGAPGAIRVTCGTDEENAAFARRWRRVAALIPDRQAGVARSVTAIVWFRRDLRLHEHAALCGPRWTPTIAWCRVFCLDDRLLHGRHASGPRTQFLLECLRDLDAALRERGGGLVVRHGPPERELPALAEEVGGGAVHFTADVSPVRARARRSDRRGPAGGGRRAVRPSRASAVADEPGEIRTQKGKPYTVFTPVLPAWSSMPAREVLRRAAHAARAAVAAWPRGGSRR